MKSRAGFLLILTLLLSLIFFIFGISLLSKSVSQHRAALDMGLGLKAQAVARAGLEDAWIKLAKDPDFPPRSSDDQESFTYSESLRDPAGGVVGSYTVTVDQGYLASPYAMLLVTSIGVVGNTTEPGATRTITAELDLSPYVRGTTDPNPNYFNWTNWMDSGSF